jgi:23S rRNA (cytidine2498-2'-O)-methyltransferase
MHLVLSADECEKALLAELSRAWPAGPHAVIGPNLISATLPTAPASLPCLVFARQLLPDAVESSATSISAWSERLVEVAMAHLPGDEPWMLHPVPHYGNDLAGHNRCRLIAGSVREKLQRKCRRLLRAWRLEPEPFTPRHTLIQLLLTAPEHGWISVARAPRPHQLRAVLAPFPKGEIPIAVDQAAPSRAFAKLLEAELRLGRSIQPGETCVDLGACPGSWSYVALQRGARVIAVDRAPLRDDLMKHPALRFQQGDAFSFRPETAVDWLLCDVIAAPQRSIALVKDWVRQRHARHFVVTIKFKGNEDYGALEELKSDLPAWCTEFYLTRLCANKNEACAFGSTGSGPAERAMDHPPP